MKNCYRLLVACILACITSSCQTSQELKLSPPSAAPVMSIKVDDVTEIELLQQRMHLDVVAVRPPYLYFHATQQQLDSLTLLGYEKPQPAQADDLYTLYGRINGTYKEEDVTNAGVKVINREKDHVIVQGTLAGLKRLGDKGYKLLQPGYEFRPREVEVTVREHASIQQMYNMGVDIFSVVPNKDSSYVAHGSAFDHQIDSMRKLHYEVKIIKDKI